MASENTPGSNGQVTGFEALIPAELIEDGHKILAANDSLVRAVMRILRRQGVLDDETDRQVCEIALEEYVLQRYANVKPEWCEEVFSMAEGYIAEDAQRGQA